ncbi:MAG: septum site-determining protein MinD [Clostridia bacterium]|nr:septum site-determining protein MinD [Clostridia bacterium]
MGKLVIVASGKGGTGKTTFSSQVGTILSTMGHMTVLVDADAGFRNLDIALGLESNVVYDYSDYITKNADIDEVLIKSPGYENLYFVAAPQSAATTDFDPGRTEQFWNTLKSRFEYVIADAPAGMGDGFRFAADYADEAVIVSLAESTSLRDADRVIEAFEDNGIEDIRLVLNRIRPELIGKKVLMNIDDCIDVLSIPILGIVPDDSAVAECAAAGCAISPSETGAARAFFNIAQRMAGENVPMMDFDTSKKSIWSRVRKTFKKSQ